MRPSTLAKLAWAGRRVDWLRITFTAAGAGLSTIAMLAAATLYWLPPTESLVKLPNGWGLAVERHHRYTSELLNDGDTWPWLAVVLVLLAIPALVFAAQSSRLGAPQRDRRLMAIRLAGAAPGQLRLIAVAETAAACLLGALAGLGAFFALRKLAHRPVLFDPYFGYSPDPAGYLEMRLPLPTDSLPPAWIFPAVVAAVPALAAALTLIALRRLTITPLAVTRLTRVRGLRWWPLAVIAAGFGLLGLHQVASRSDFGDQDLTLPLTAWSAVILLSVGVALCAAPLGQLAARVALWGLRTVSPQLAARWIVADPWSGSRSLAVMLIAVFGAAASIEGISYGRSIGIGGALLESGLHRFGLVILSMTLLVAVAGLLFAIVEGLLTRRRALVSLVAAGVPVGVLARAVLWQALLPSVPAVVLAIVVGHTAMVTAQTMASPHPIWAQLALGLSAIGGVTAAAALSLLVLRSTVDVTELRVE